MKYDVLDPEGTVLKLASRAYSATEVASAVEITPGVLTNYLTKSQLNLLSEPKGRGKSRKFHLADIYSMSIMKTFVKLTGRQDWSARIIEYLLFLPAHEVSKQPKPLKFGDNISDIRENFLSNMRELRPAYWQRKWHDASWILFIEDIDARNDAYGFKLFRAGEALSFYNSVGFLLNSDDGHYVNVTFNLTEVDKRLCKIVGNDLW